MSNDQRHEIRGNRQSAILGTLGGWAMKLLVFTLRLKVHDRCGISSPKAAIPPSIYILWHNRFFTIPAAYNKICRPHRHGVTLTSASRDGAMVARAMAVFGFGAVRGSSSRRGVAALVGLKRALQDGFDVCLTPDGPRGPRYQIQPGAIKLAESSGAAIIPIHVRYTAAWRLRTWDRFIIPKPFSRVDVTFGETITLPHKMDAADFENTRLQIEALMVNGVDDA